MTTSPAEPTWVGEVLHFWFDELGRKLWFVKDDATDAVIRARFSALIDDLAVSAIEDAVATPDRALASVIALDQFPRNIYRGTPRAFENDELSRAIAKLAVAISLDQRIAAERRIFLYLPFEHSEALADQYRSVELISSLGDEEYIRFAEAHCGVIARFGRFPHRNAILGRPSTAEEAAFLEQPGSAF